MAKRKKAQIRKPRNAKRVRKPARVVHKVTTEMIDTGVTGKVIRINRKQTPAQPIYAAGKYPMGEWTGMLKGDGHVGLQIRNKATGSMQPILSMSNTDLRLLESMKEVIPGVGRITPGRILPSGKYFYELCYTKAADIVAICKEASAWGSDCHREQKMALMGLFPLNITGGRISETLRRKRQSWLARWNNLLASQKAEMKTKGNEDEIRRSTRATMNVKRMKAATSEAAAIDPFSKKIHTVSTSSTINLPKATRSKTAPKAPQLASKTAKLKKVRKTDKPRSKKKTFKKATGKKANRKKK